MMVGWHNGPLCAFDVETTSPIPLECRIVTASIVTISREKRVVKTSWLVNPGIEIPEEASRIHGITTEKAVKDGKSPAIVLPQIVAKLASCDCPIIAFNASFDFTVLNEELKRSGLCKEWHDKEFSPIIDPFVIDKQVDRFRKGKRNLRAIAEHYGAKEFAAHSSDDDALTAARIAWKMAAKIAELADHHPAEIHEQTKRWYREQAISLKEYFVKLAHQNEAEFDAIMKKANDVSVEWPIRASST